MTSSHETPRLLPCPFCGGEADVDVDGLGKWLVGCQTFVADVICPGNPFDADPRNCYTTERQAIEAWNRRLSSSSGEPETNIVEPEAYLPFDMEAARLAFVGNVLGQSPDMTTALTQFDAVRFACWNAEAEVEKLATALRSLKAERDELRDLWRLLTRERHGLIAERDEKQRRLTEVEGRAMAWVQNLREAMGPTQRYTSPTGEAIVGAAINDLSVARSALLDARREIEALEQYSVMAADYRRHITTVSLANALAILDRVGGQE